MTTRWQCIALATLCCLLAVATSASAECAWVLWAVYPTTLGRHEIPVSTHETKEKCLIAFDKVKTEGIMVPTSCFPDTVDPRTPKGTK
jgi:hypothetical protein